MSHHEAQKIRKKLAPFMSLLLVVACMGLLASCGGGGQNTTSTADVGVSQAASTDKNLPVTSQEARVNDNGIPAGRELTSTEEYNGSAVAKNEVLIFSSSISREKLIQVLGKYGYSLVGESSFYQVDVTNTGIVNAIASFKSEGINAIPNYVGNTTNSLDSGDEYSSSTSPFAWAIDSIKARNAWQYLDGLNRGVRVGIVDGGFRFNHEDIGFSKIYSKFWVKTSGDVPNYCVDSLDSFSLSEEADSCLSATHGMNVSSIIAANNNGKGLAGIAFMNTVKPFAYKADSTIGDAYDGLFQLVNENAKVINLSMGVNFKALGYKKANNPWNPDLINAVLSDLSSKYNDNFPDVLIVQSSGNDGDKKYSDTGDSIHMDANGYFASIASIDESLVNAANIKIFRQLKARVIIVGAFDSDKKLTSYTQTPKSINDSTFILAPGGSAGKTYIDSYATGLNIPKMIAGAAFKGAAKYSRMGGTSQATPHVSGVAALVWMANPNLSASEVRDIILTNSDTVDGYRALNAEKAVRAALDTLTKPTVTVSASPSTTPQLGQAVTFTANVTNAPNGAIKTYSWSFGDGTTFTGQTTPTSPPHTYSTAGDFAVTVTVVDEKGASATSAAVHIIPVSPNPTPTVTSISSPSAKAGVNSQFVIAGTNLPMTEDLTVNVFASNVGCSSFGYDSVNRSSTQHNFACTPTAGGTLTFSVSTKGGTALGTWNVTVSPATTATVFNEDFNALDSAIWAYTPGGGGTGTWTDYAIENSQFKFGNGVLSTEGKKTFSGSSKITVEFVVNYPNASAYRDLRIFLIKSDFSKAYGVREGLMTGVKQMFITDSGVTTQPYTYTDTPNQILFTFTLDSSGIALSANGGTLNYGVSKGFTDGRSIAGDYFLRILGDGTNYIEGIKVTTE